MINQQHLSSFHSTNISNSNNNKNLNDRRMFINHFNPSNKYLQHFTLNNDCNRNNNATDKALSSKAFPHMFPRNAFFQPSNTEQNLSLNQVEMFFYKNFLKSFNTTEVFNNANKFSTDASKRKSSCRESSTALKAWLIGHPDNPYPTKSEKVMLALLTRMTLTQVSTWFANARRRLKKEKTLRCHEGGKNGGIKMDDGEREMLQKEGNCGDMSNDEDNEEIESVLASSKNINKHILNHQHHHRFFLSNYPQLHKKGSLSPAYFHDNKSHTLDSHTSHKLSTDMNILNTPSFSSFSSSSFSSKDTTNTAKSKFKSGEGIWSIEDIIGT